MNYKIETNPRIRMGWLKPYVRVGGVLRYSDPLNGKVSPHILVPTRFISTIRSSHVISIQPSNLSPSHVFLTYP